MALADLEDGISTLVTLLEANWNITNVAKPEIISRRNEIEYKRVEANPSITLERIERIPRIVSLPMRRKDIFETIRLVITTPYYEGDSTATLNFLEIGKEVIRVFDTFNISPGGEWCTIEIVREDEDTIINTVYKYVIDVVLKAPSRTI